VKGARTIQTAHVGGRNCPSMVLLEVSSSPLSLSEVRVGEDWLICYR